MKYLVFAYLVIGMVTVDLNSNTPDIFQFRKWHAKSSEGGVFDELYIIFVLLFWPLIYLGFFTDWHRNKKSSASHSQVDKGNPYINAALTFQGISGAGIIACINCGWSQRIICSVHGFDENAGKSYSASGFQCQQCGNFEVISDDDVQPGNEGILKCHCGGYYTRKETLFCPLCKSRKLEYPISIGK